ncbi:FAD-binding oxidoreductase [Streptomyces sp. ST2-7A]|uniref:FAD-binding oxidoreductase n=1 Tax=Streptomyces sp. ST2-7A TaxID=2907214 RepID=UPI001F293E50|nr:FAD-binding oxidoreductase [Streptomyces sp. ST2-7A]MCE7081117.1 FAD-binding oxidoreductase [Streptomyces sp. ST2-7A]
MTDSIASPSAAGSAVLGPVTVGRDDPRYEDLAVRHSNARWRSEPEHFVLVSSTEQVVEAVGAAVRAGRRVAVRSGGHCYENFVSEGNAPVVIDLAELNAIGYDEERGAFVIEAGAALLDVYRRLFFGWGVTIPGGSCGTVAVGGHVCGGGYGAHSRQFGLTVDYLEAVEVVVADADGSVRAVVGTRDPADPHHDLWWAHTGGGGGNFGVVTRYWFRDPAAAPGTAPERLLPAPPHTVLHSQVIWPWEGMDKESLRRIVRNHGAWHERHSDPDSPYAGLYGGLVLFGREAGEDPGPAVISFAQIDGTTADARELLQGYVDAIAEGVGARPMVLPFTESPWMALTVKYSRLQETTGQRLKIKAAELRRRYPDHQVDTIHDWLTAADPGRGQVTVSFQSYGGKIREVAPEATAVVHRDSVNKVLFYSTWEDPELDKTALEHLRHFYRAVYAETGGVPVPDETHNGAFVNFPDSDLADPAWNTSDTPWYELYYGANYPRLQRTKAAWDPRDVFWHSLSVRPAR